MALPYSDTFLQTSGGVQAINVYNAGWSNVIGGFQVPDAAGEARSTTNGENVARWGTDAPNADHYAEIITATGWAATGVYVGAAVRVQSGAATAYYVYGNATAWELIRLNAGAASILASGSWTATDGQPIRIQAAGVGTTVTVTVTKAGANVTTFNDTSGSRITTAGFGGISAYDITASSPSIASFEVGNLGGGSSELSGSSTPDVLVSTGTLQGGSTVTGTSSPDVLVASGTISAPNSLSGDAAPDVLVSTGQVSGGSTIAGAAALEVLQASGAIAGGAGSGTFTTDPLARNNNTLAPNSPLTWLGFRVHATGTPVLLLTGQSTDASAAISVTHASLSPGTVYRADWLEASGEYGHWVAAAV